MPLSTRKTIIWHTPGPDPIAWIKAIAVAVKWPFKIMLILFLLCVFLLTPWASKLPDYPQIQPHLVWIVLLCGFSGLFVIFSAIDRTAKAVWGPLRDWREERGMDAKLKNLAADEVAVLLPYLENGEARQHITAEATSALRSLIDKGILTPAGEITGYWLDRLAFDLTPAANRALRKTEIQNHLRP